MTEYCQDLAAILDRLNALIQRQARDEEPLDQLEAQLRPRERAAIRASLQAELSRAEQVRSTPTGPTLNLHGFHAVGNNRVDDGPALRAAVAALAQLGPGSMLHIPAGRYRIDDFGGTPMRTHLLLQDLRGVTIRGEGIGRTELVGTQIGTLLRIENCTNLRVADLSLDFDPLPFTQGVIEAIEPDNFSVIWRRQPGWFDPIGFPFNNPNDPTIHAACVGVKVHCETTGRVLNHGGFTVARIEPLSEGRYQLHGKKQPWESGRDLPDTFIPGRPLVIQSRNVPGHQPAVWTAGNTRLTLERLAVYASWSHAFQFTADTTLKAIACVTEPKPDTNRLAVSNADGLHIVSQRVGPYIKDCRIRRNYDDTANLYCKVVSVIDQPAPDCLVLDAVFDAADRATNWQPDRRHFHVGDQLAIIDPMTAEIVGAPIITAVGEHNWRGFRRVAVALGAPLPPVATRESLGKRHAVFSNMEFYMCKPDELLEAMVINLQAKCDGFVIRDSIFGENSVNGIKLKASNGIVEGNHFDRNANTGITLLMRLTWQEAFAPRNVRITNNTFTGTNGIHSVIDYPGERFQFGPPYIGDIEIIHNRFERTTGFALHLFNLRDSLIRSNTIESGSAMPLLVEPNCSGVEIADNLITQSVEKAHA